MSVERNHQYVGLSCDECPEATEEFRDFDAMIAAAKALGWLILPQEDGYEHICPACAQGRNEDRVAKAQRLLGKPRKDSGNGK